MTDDPSSRKAPPREAPSAVWPLSATLITSLAVAATVGLAMVAYVLGIAGGPIRGRLLAVLPIYFIAAFFSVLVVFWGLHALIAWLRREFAGGGMGAREHGITALLTFLVVSLLHYAQGPEVQRMLQEQGSEAAQAGSCPEGGECLPMRPVDALEAASAEERRRLAGHGRLTAAGFAALMRDAQAPVRAALAGRSDLPGELLERLAGDRVGEVREAVAASPRLSDASLTRLALDREERVRLAVARNRHAPPTALDVLAGSPSGEIRDLVAAHPNASEPVLRRLLNGSGDRAEKLARERLGERR